MPRRLRGFDDHETSGGLDRCDRRRLTETQSAYLTACFRPDEIDSSIADERAAESEVTPQTETAGNDAEAQAVDNQDQDDGEPEATASPRSAAQRTAIDAALTIVRERYARGEISREEFLQLRDDLNA